MADKDGGDDVFESAIEILSGTGTTSLGQVQSSAALTGRFMVRSTPDRVISIASAQAGVYRVQVYNALGLLVHDARVSGGRAWSARSTAGLYFVKVTGSSQTMLQRVLVK
jgi:hypothetical protein